jgi:hypothetical protein
VARAGLRAVRRFALRGGAFGRPGILGHVTQQCDTASDLHRSGEEVAAVITILMVVLVLMLLGSVPAWPYSREWGYAPSGTLTLIVLILVLMMASGRL